MNKVMKGIRIGTNEETKEIILIQSNEMNEDATIIITSEQVDAVVTWLHEAKKELQEC